MHVGASLPANTNSADQLSCQTFEIRCRTFSTALLYLEYNTAQYRSRCSRWPTLDLGPSLGSLPIDCHKAGTVMMGRLFHNCQEVSGHAIMAVSWGVVFASLC